ncbi:MAG TPA: efflux RND transporter periplasmic adaptor subunit [Myxococcota bacterium]|nr:efflux RND transporter periplasmic adaptor subunit [Myxococcota bacterium]
MNPRIAIFLLILFALCGVACRGTPPAAEAEPKVEGAQLTLPPESPQLASLQIDPPREARAGSLRLNGRLAWDETATVRVYSPFAGRVTEVVVEPGARVSRGDILARIASSDFGQAEADARKADSELRLAERTLVRVRDLYEHGAAAQKDLETAEDDQVRARSESERARSRLAAYGADARSVDGSFALRAPIDGIVVERATSRGQEIRNDQMLAGTPQLAAPLFTITDPERLWVVVDVSEHDAPNLHPGDPLRVRLHADPGEMVPGRIEVVSDFFDSATRMLKVRGSLANTDRRLRAEMLVTVELDVPDQAPVAEVPSSAVLLEGEKHYVYVQNAPGTFERREVAIGAERDGWMPVASGVDSGHGVVTRGALLLEQIYKDAGS